MGVCVVSLSLSLLSVSVVRLGSGVWCAERRPQRTNNNTNTEEEWQREAERVKAKMRPSQGVWLDTTKKKETI